MTALLYAISSGQFENARQLLLYGADANIANSENQPALDDLNRYAFGSVVEMLRSIFSRAAPCGYILNRSNIYDHLPVRIILEPYQN